MNLLGFSETARKLCGLGPIRPVIVGVSGGPDSICLLILLAREGFPLVVAHFDHQLRPESALDAETVRSIAQQMNIPFVLGRQDVAAYARQDRLSLEEAARISRYRFLFAQARDLEAQAVAVGHTADDQVETVLMHLLRGTGLDGLSGMPYRGILPEFDPSIPLVRPLLTFWRSETEAFCREHGISPLVDPTNQDKAYFRNRVRHELIPYLETYNPQVRESLWRMAQVLDGDRAIVQSKVDRAWLTCLVEASDTSVSLRLATLKKLPIGLQRSVLRRAVALMRPADLRNIDFAVIERAVQLVQSPYVGPKQIDLASGLRLRSDYGQLEISGASALQPDPLWLQMQQDQVSLPVPGEVLLSSGWSLRAEWVDLSSPHAFDDPDEEAGHAWLDAGTVTAALTIRCPQPGDRFQPLGLGGRSVKLSDFWINQKLPRRARAAWPLVLVGEGIAWVPGFRPAESFRLRPDSRRALHLWVSRSEEAQK